MYSLEVSASSAESDDRLRRWTRKSRANADRKQHSLHSRLEGRPIDAMSGLYRPFAFRRILINAEGMFHRTAGKILEAETHS